MPGFTHLKNAQPIVFAHYLLAYIEMFQRDKKRFLSNIKYIDECPLGAAALAGTSYNIDRKFTAKKFCQTLFLSKSRFFVEAQNHQI